MALVDKLVNIFGDTWHVEHRDSEHLTTISGFLMTCGQSSRLTLSTQLDYDSKKRAREHLLGQLAETPIGKSSVRLWHPDNK
jgi:hypothetical protein